MIYVFKMPPVGHYIVLNSHSLACLLRLVGVAKSNLFFFFSSVLLENETLETMAMKH